MPKDPKTIYHEVGKEFSLNGVENQMLLALVQPEINIPGKTGGELSNVLKNFRKESPVLRAYLEFLFRLSK